MSYIPNGTYYTAKLIDQVCLCLVIKAESHVSQRTRLFVLDLQVQLREEHQASTQVRAFDQIPKMFCERSISLASVSQHL